MSTPKDGILDSQDLSALRSVYQELLGFDDRTIIDMPHTITEFKAVKVGSVSNGSLQWQTSRNATVLANWAGPDGSLACTTGCNDTRPGQVLKFFRHCFKVKLKSTDSLDKRYEFYLAQVNWFSKHPEWYAYGLPVELWCNAFDLFGLACFFPIQRIKSVCASGETTYKRETVPAITN